MLILNKRVAGILCVLVPVGLLFAGLWPFDIAPKNRACWIPNQEGLHFDGQNRRFKLSVGGIAYTASPLNSLKPSPSGKGSFTVEIVLMPTAEVKSSVPHILGFTDSSGREIFYLGQWKQSLIVRWFTYDGRGKRRMREIGVRDALIKNRTQRLTLVSSGTSCSVHVNGRLAKSFSGVSLVGGGSIRGCSIALGNSRDVKRPWTGTVLALKVYESGLSEAEIAQDPAAQPKYASQEGLIAAYEIGKGHSTLIADLSGNKNALTVPERVTVTNNALAWPDWRNQKDSSSVPDIAVNVLGFVPFGFLLAFWREQINGSKRWRFFLPAVLLGALLSLLIEVTQAFIPARDSNIVDVICNTAGTALGAGLQMAMKRESSRLKT